MSNRPRVLILTDWFVPGYKAGGPIQSVHRLVKLLSEEVEFFVLTSDRDLEETKSYEGITTNEWLDIEGCKVMYLTPGERSKMIEKTLRAWAGDFIYFNSFFSTEFTIKPLVVLWRLKRLSEVIIAPRGMLGEGALSIKPIKKKLFVALFRRIGLHRKLVFHATDASEYESIRNALGDASKQVIIPNVPVQVLDSKPAIDHKPIKTFVYASRISPKKNLKFLLELWTESARSNAELLIYGQGDDRLYEDDCDKLIRSYDSIVKLGPVPPKELHEAFTRSNFFVLPTKNENFGHAIIESLAHGCPVIISDQTPWNDLEEKGAGWVIPLDDKARWSTVLDQASEMTEEEWHAMSHNAIDYVKHTFDLTSLKAQYIELFGETR